jgi:hypothetical protein
MIPELAAQYAARASGAAISQATIKEITLVLNGRTQPARDGDFSCRNFLNPRTAAPERGSLLKKRPRS